MSLAPSSSSTRIVLSPEVSLDDWINDLQAKLAKEGVIGHVYHQFEGIRPIHRPAAPTDEIDSADYLTGLDAYATAVETWTLGEIRAKNIILGRLNPTMRPRNHDRITAHQLYQSITDSRRETATAPYALALEEFLRTKFESHADDYINKFLANLQGLNDAAETLHATTGTEYHVPRGLAAAIFVQGTRHIPWLTNWRDMRACTDQNSYATLESLMSTIRIASGNRTVDPTPQAAPPPQPNRVFATREPTERLDPEAKCRRCNHRHKNRECFKQHPQLANGPRGERCRARRAIGRQGGTGQTADGNMRAVTSIDTDSENEDSVGMAASAHSTHTHLVIYDTGASHHFVPCESMFRNMHSRHKPLRFDQAVGDMQLTKQGVARITIGKLVIDLHDALYSPKSSCIIISAGRLQRLGNITCDADMTRLIMCKPNHEETPIAELLCKNDVYYIKPLTHLREKTHTHCSPWCCKSPEDV